MFVSTNLYGRYHKGICEQCMLLPSDRQEQIMYIYKIFNGSVQEMQFSVVNSLAPSYVALLIVC